MDNTKHVNIIKTYKLLEFLGDISGFKEFIEIMFGLVGFYISSTMFKADFIQKLFQQKVVEDYSTDEDDT